MITSFDGETKKYVVCLYLKEGIQSMLKFDSIVIPELFLIYTVTQSP